MTHGSWCHAKTIPMTCKYCGEKVFFFFCNCGCKVFFDELGDPWPRHNCQEYINSIQSSSVNYYVDIIKKIDKIEKRLVDKNIQKGNKLIINDNGSWELIFDKEENIILDDEFKDIININKNKGHSNNIHILKIENQSNETIEVIGKIVEIVLNVNIEKKFNVDLNSIIAANFLKKLNKGPYTQITIHSLNLADKNKNSYTALVESKFIKSLKKGDSVGSILSGDSINNYNYWKCNIIEKLEL
jgi:hypothetical protein